MPLPVLAKPCVDASQSSGKPRARCSVTIHDSNAEKSSDVEMPPSTRPRSSKYREGKCSRVLMITSSTQKRMQPMRRPYLSTYRPTQVPNRR